jgi:hypothetical protein
MTVGQLLLRKLHSNPHHLIKNQTGYNEKEYWRMKIKLLGEHALRRE